MEVRGSHLAGEGKDKRTKQEINLAKMKSQNCVLRRKKLFVPQVMIATQAEMKI